MTELRRSHLFVATPDGSADSYLVQPATGTHPGVLMFMDGIGLRPRLEEMADHIAGRGYAVLVPNLFYRGGRAPIIPNLVDRLRTEDRGAVFEEIRPHIASLTPD